MKLFPIPLLFLLVIFACERPSESKKNSETIPSVTLASHLNGPLDGDPVLALGQTVCVVPHASEPPSGRSESLVVTLPEDTPYSGQDELFFLRGYAIGKLSDHNVRYICYSHSSAARKHESWDAGYQAAIKEISGE